MAQVKVDGVSLDFGPVSVLKSLDLTVGEGEFLVLLGPSGCGKSTLLNCIAGLLDVTRGRIFIDGRNVTWDEPKDRGIGMVFQSYALYPQMTVERNLSFGLRIAGVAKADITRRVQRTAEILQIEPLLARKPSELSGGQRQRVAIGRALVRDAGVFLFDEPLSNLDAKLRSELRVELKRLHRRLGSTMIYVTHDQVEALTLADRIAVMKGGIIQQLADPLTIYHTPANLFVAGFIGSPRINLVTGKLTARDGGTAFEGQNFTVPIDAYPFAAPPQDGQPAVLGIRPEHLVIGGNGSAGPSFDMSVEIVEPMGADTVVWCRAGPGPMAIRTEGDTRVATDQTIQVSLPPDRLSLFSAETEARL